MYTSPLRFQLNSPWVKLTTMWRRHWQRIHSPQHCLDSWPRTVAPKMTDQHQQPHSLLDNIASPDSSSGSSTGTGTSSATTTTHHDGPCKSLKIERARTDESNRQVATIDILLDDVFREIFAICLFKRYRHPTRRMRVWQRLVHVCQRWRQIIYGSPHYFDLHLYCSNGYGLAFKDFSVWPEFPLVIQYYIECDEDGLIAALEHPDRVRRIVLHISSSEVFDTLRAMEVPFPVLTHLELTGHNEDRLKDMLYLPSDFLGGSAPCLQHLSVTSAALGDLPKLLLSTRDLVSLQLENVSPWGYISPEEIVGGLAGLTRLRTLSITFVIPYERWGSPMHPQPCAVLPALTEFEFRGGSGYLDELMAQIDTPRVEDVRIEYSELDVQAPQFSEFIKHSQFKHARVDFSPYNPEIKLDCPQGECHKAHYSLIISELGLRDFTVVHLLGQLVPMLSNVAHLSVLGEDSMDEVLPFLRLFPAVEAMDVDRKAAGYIAEALEDIAEEMVTEVLPALEWLLLDGDDNKLEGFLSLRRLSGRPVTIFNTRDEFVERLNARWENV
ncbi:hypothetical protein EDB85DRAFT_1613451 [Lactarius pseudohatsudake]|nr:hypothetical protein EDB85DRAFT_1613451 [Lactarius pseudohatsudake]